MHDLHRWLQDFNWHGNAWSIAPAIVRIMLDVHLEEVVDLDDFTLDRGGELLEQASLVFRYTLLGFLAMTVNDGELHRDLQFFLLTLVNTFLLFVPEVLVERD